MIFFCFSNNSGFGVFLVLPETTLPDGLETSGRRAYRYFLHIFRLFDFLRFGWFFFFCFSKKIVFLGIFGPAYCGIGATNRIGREMLCLPAFFVSKQIINDRRIFVNSSFF